MMVTDSCIFLMVLLLIVERWPDTLFSILLIPLGGKFVSCSVAGICLVVFSICTAIFKWATEICSGAQPLLTKWACLWWVAMPSKLALFVLWVLFRPKHLPLNRHSWVGAVVWCRSCQEEFQAEMRQSINLKISHLFSFSVSVVWVTHTHILDVFTVTVILNYSLPKAV